MVDKILEGIAGLVDLLQVDAVLLTILLRVHVAVPAVFLQLWNRIDRGIEVGHFLRTQRAAQNNEAIEVEVVDFSVGWFHADQSNTTSRLTTRQTTPHIGSGEPSKSVFIILKI